MSKRNRPSVTYPVNEKGEIADDRPITRRSAFTKEFEGIIPYCQIMLFNPLGKILLPTRAEKYLFPFMKIPLTAGGFLTVRETLEVEGEKRFDFSKGAIEEFNEELRPEREPLHRAEISRLDKLCGIYDFKSVTGKPEVPKIYIEFFSAIYDEDRHGNFNPDRSEIIGPITENDWFTPKRIVEEGILENVSLNYGKLIMKRGILPHYKELSGDRGMYNWFVKKIHKIFPFSRGNNAATF